ncbi:MAG: hypothetical protein ACLS8R_00335 [Anaeromassilibacillus sp.]
MGIKPVNDLMEKMGITEEQMEAMESEFGSLMNPENNGENNEEGFTPGGAATFPFLQNIFGYDEPAEGRGDAAPSSAPKRDKRKAQDKAQSAGYVLHRPDRESAPEIDKIIGAIKRFRAWYRS